MPSHAKKTGRRALPLTRKQLIAAGAAVVVVIGVVVGITLAGSPKRTNGNDGPSTSSSTSSSTPAVVSTRCPLTDTPAPGGKVPGRPALAVSVGNEPEGARPQSGLNEADIVYDTPAEGGIMRYVVVYQCNEASQIGPTRSVRWVEWHIMAMFRNRPLLIHAGGINPDLATLDSLRYVQDVNLLGNSPGSGANSVQDGVRISSRVPPDNLYTSTQTAWSTFKKEWQAPKPVFDYKAALPASATPLSSVQIDFSYGTDSVWTWSPTEGVWLHSYAGSGPDVDALTNKQVSTNNVFVQIVHYQFGPNAESPGGSGDVESVMTGTGSGYLLRNGKEIKVTWHRPTLGSPTTFTDASGQEVGLTPGRTFVEILLDTTAKIHGALTFTK